MTRVTIGAYEVEDQEQLLHLLKTDDRFFIAFYLSEHMTSPTPDFHVDIFQPMTDEAVELYCCAVPRDHAKTTLAKLANVKMMLFSNAKFFLYVSNTATIAIDAAKDIVGFLESDNHVAMFGPVRYVVNQAGNGFYIFYIGEKKIILRAIGAGQQVRGMNIDNTRPQYVTVDDLESNENTETALLQAKLKRWFYGPFFKCVSKAWHKIVMIGNMISNKCLLQMHCDSEYWDSMRYGAIKADGQSLWPEEWPLDKLRREFQMYAEMGQIDIWYAEMMNMPVGGGRSLIKQDQIKYLPATVPMSNSILYGFITIDPAISKQKWAHKAAVVVHAFVVDTWQIVDYWTGLGPTPMELYDLANHFCEKWKISCIGIESVAYQASLKFVFAHFDIVNHIEGRQYFDCPASAQKTQRLAGWAAMIKAGNYALNEGDYLITSQLLMYNPLKDSNDDDLIDAAAHGVHMLENYLDAIQTNVFQAAKPHEPVSGLALSGW